MDIEIEQFYKFAKAANLREIKFSIYCFLCNISKIKPTFVKIERTAKNKKSKAKGRIQYLFQPL